MAQYIVDKAIQYFPQISGYFIVALVVGMFVWKLCAFYIRTNTATKKIPLIESLLSKIDRGFNTLNQILLEKSVISQSVYSSANSPRTINALGQKLFTDSGAEILFERIKTGLMAELEGKTFGSLLELERECLNLFLGKMNDPEFKNIQNFAFEHPTFGDNPLTYTDILFVMSLKLREEYRTKHPTSNLG
ncbi:MAG: hypothetical protein Q8R12_04415 [bacterium]|nr:hypothetical protein [bacterium]